MNNNDNKVDFDKFTDDYNVLLRENTQFFSASEEYFAKYKVDLVRKAITHPVRRILEYGCGIGRNVPYLASSFPGAEIVGTDISTASLKQAAAENPNARFELESGSLDLGAFDLVFVAGVFHHIPAIERNGASRSIAARLNASGSACVFEHNPYNPVTRRIVNSCPYDADAVLLKPRELRTLLGDAELSVVASSYCLFVPPKLSWLSPVEARLGWLPLGGQYWVHARKP